MSTNRFTVAGFSKSDINCSFETVVPAVAVLFDRIGVGRVGRGGWGAPGAVDHALQSTGGHLLEKLRTSRLGMRLPGCPE